MHPFKNEVEQMLVILKNAQSDIQAIDNPAMAALTNRVLTDINRNINFLSMQIGATVDNHITQPPPTRPLRSFLGAPIVRKEEVAVLEVESGEEDVEKALKLTPEEIAFNELKVVVDELYPMFTELETDAIIDKYSDLEIRGVGKRAGLPITEKHPKKMDAKQVELIKAAIKKKAQIESENP